MSGAPPVLRHMPFGMHRYNCSKFHFGDSIEGENREIFCGLKWQNVWSTVIILTCKRAALTDLSDCHVLKKPWTRMSCLLVVTLAALKNALCSAESTCPRTDRTHRAVLQQPGGSDLADRGKPTLLGKRQSQCHLGNYLRWNSGLRGERSQLTAWAKAWSFWKDQEYLRCSFRSSSYRAVNALHLGNKNQSVNAV